MNRIKVQGSNEMRNMKQIFLLLTAALLLGACNTKKTAEQTEEALRYVTVKNGEFYLGDKPYRFVGTNFWYGPILASEGRGGDTLRLKRELDAMQELGIDNLRVLVGGDGRDHLPSHISPVLQTAPGVYNDTLLRGLDRFLYELEKRNMRCVLYLNNAWEWSGGYGSYLEWAGAGQAPIPSVDGWPAYMSYVQQFLQNEEAMTMSLQHVQNIVLRKNTITGKEYKFSPAIMSWQIANEPRAFSEENKPRLKEFISKTAKLIHTLDRQHLVSTGTEGMHGCEEDLELFTEIHALPEIDYANIHIWPYNWGWITKDNVAENVDSACWKTAEYINLHYAQMYALGKPITLEEFGYPRDGFSFTPGSPATGREKYYKYVFDIVVNSNKIAGCNFWGWAGYAQPRHIAWQEGDDYTGDPAQEEQGLNSVFMADKSVLNVVKQANETLKQK